MGKKITTAAFVTGAAVGTVAGLLSKKKNRQRVTRVTKKATNKFESFANEGIDFTRDKLNQFSTNLQNRD